MNQTRTTPPATVYLAWAVVTLPLVWALWQTFIKVVELFK
jgi:hypothetical protein